MSHFIKKLEFLSALITIFLISSGFNSGHGMEDSQSRQVTRLVPSQKHTKSIIDQSSSGSIAPQQPRLNQGSLERMPFQLGFEFQEISGLCPWAKNIPGLDKQPLFSVHLKNDPTPLWHLEIDDVDIEFVTPPFPSQEKGRLQLAISTIQQTMNQLTALLNQKGSIDFNNWTNLILNTLGLDKFEIHLHDRFYSIQEQLLIMPSKQLKNSQSDFEATGKELVPIKEFQDWQPVFAPQATIQHPLEDTIPLYLSLFGFDSQYMINFLAGIPMLDEFKAALKFADTSTINQFIDGFRQKVNGLIFLQALTMTTMTPFLISTDLEDDVDSQALKETAENLAKYGQIDSKLRLTIMSRRPFSDMYKNLGQYGYAPHLATVMGRNSSFTRTNQVPDNFRMTNYGEEYLTLTGRPADLSAIIMPLLNDTFLSKNRDTLAYLLSRGVVTSAMLRHLKDNIQIESLLSGNKIPINQIFNEYFVNAVSSVENPKRRYALNPNNMTIGIQKTSTDSLSPPWFMKSTNSMGYYRNLPPKQLINGEAIIEVRGIGNVQPWFLERAGLDKNILGRFLKYPSDDMVGQATALFDFLTNFRSEKNMIDIFYLGLPYAVHKHY